MHFREREREYRIHIPRGEEDKEMGERKEEDKGSWKWSFLVKGTFGMQDS